MPKKKNDHNKSGAGIGEEVRIAVNLSLKKFLRTDENKGKIYFFIIPKYKEER